MVKRYLITGVAGFVGSTLARRLLREDLDVEVVGIDDFSAGYPRRIEDLYGQSRFTFQCQSLTARLEPQFGLDAIIHCAAIAPLPECQKNLYECYVQNVAVVGAVADFAIRSGCKRVIHFSSGAVYENQTHTEPSVEDTGDLRTTLAYPTSKVMSEMVWDSVVRSHGLDVTAIRLFNLYGPEQDYFRKQPPLIGYLIRCLLQDEMAVLFSNSVASRNYIYIDDLTRFVKILLNSTGRGGKELEVLNAAAEGEVFTVPDIIRTLAKVSGKHLRVHYKEPKEYWDQKFDQLFKTEVPLRREVVEQEVLKKTRADMEKVKLRYGFESRVRLEEGLRECYEFAKELFSGDNQTI